MLGRRLAFLTTLCCVVAVVMLGSYLLPARYTAKADLLVEQGRSAQMLPTMSGQLATEAELLQSERVAIAALALLGMREDPVLRQKWKEKSGGRGEFESWAAEELSKKLNVMPSRNSNILTVSYSSPDPVLAAKTVNALLKAYVDTARELRGESATQSSATFSDRTSRLKTALDLAAEKLARFQRENGVASTDERLDIENLRLSELNAQLVMLQSTAANAAGRQRYAAGGSGMEEVLRDPLVATLSADLARQQAKFAEMRSKLGDQHPAIAEQRESLADLKGRLDAATRRASSAIATDSRIASERAGSVQAALTAQRAKVMEVKSKRDQAQRLQLELDAARRAFDAAVTRANEAVLDSDSSRGNVSIIKTATVPAKPAFPRPADSLAAALVLGLLAAVVVVLWLESGDRRLRLDEEVSELLEQPLLGVISHGRRSTPLLQLSNR